MSTDDPPQEPTPNGSGDDSIKVEVVPPESDAAEKDPVKELEGQVTALEKDKKDNWDR